MKKILQYVNGKEMKENVDNIDDEYYTKPSAAKKCFEKAIEIISKYDNIDEYLWIEPSAGSCNFYNLLPKERRIGIDINPINKDIIQHDYLTYNLPK